MKNTFPRTPGIYAIVHKRSKRRYVGSSVDLCSRLHGHLRSLRSGAHHSRYLLRAWLKYGEKEFSAVVLELVDDPARLIEREQYHIDAGADFNAVPKAGSQLGFKFTDEQRQKLSESHKGQTPSLANRIAVSKACTGRVYSEESLRRMSESQKGREVSEVTKAKLSMTQKALWQDPEYRKNNTEKHRGKTRSAEAKAKTSASILTAQRRSLVWAYGIDMNGGV